MFRLSERGMGGRTPHGLVVLQDDAKDIYRESPFSLVYGMKAVISVDIRVESHRTEAFGKEENEEVIEESLKTIE